MEVSKAELLEALGRASSLISTARKYFPKSIKNSDRFELENTNALVASVKVKLQEETEAVNVYSRRRHRSA